MRLQILPVSVLLSLLLIITPISAKFFTNITSVPPSLLPNSNTSAWDGFQKLADCRRGDKADELPKLKQYFQRFGYIPEDVDSNFTDEFDDSLESAIKMYQKNFNLNLTGQLDQLTLRKIVLPRCGNADIINGTSSMNIGGERNKTNPSPPSRLHAVQHYAFFPGVPRWPERRRNLTYAFRPENQLTEEVKNVFARAFDRWATVTPMTFRRSEAYTSADIKIGFYVGDHGDGEPFDGRLGTLAHAFSPTNGRFHLDGDEDWVIAGDFRNIFQTTSAVDLESVAVHEIGHLLGLGHSSIEEAIMYPTITTATKKVELASDDIEGIQSLYGPNPTYNGSITPSNQGEQTSGFVGSESVSNVCLIMLLLAVGFMFSDL